MDLKKKGREEGRNEERIEECERKNDMILREEDRTESEDKSWEGDNRKKTK